MGRGRASSLLVRNVVFGVEDGLVSTVGFLSGIAAASLGKSTLLLTGVVLILVEAFSMAVGSMLSEHSVEEYEEGRETSLWKPLQAALVMFVSYVTAGFIPLAPYLFLDTQTGLWASIGVSLVAMGILGWINAARLKLSVGNKILEMVVLGGLAIVVGFVVGRILT